MNKKIIGILVCTLMIAATVLPVTGSVNNNEIKLEEQDIDSLILKDGVAVFTDVYEEKVIVNRVNTIVDRLDKSTIIDDFGEENMGGGQSWTTLTGYVYDEVTSEGIDGAKVIVTVKSDPMFYVKSDTTNETGEYFIEIGIEPITGVGYVNVSKEGYNTLDFVYVELIPGGDNTYDFYLNTRPTADAGGSSYYGSRGYLGDPIEFNGTGDDPNGDIVLYEWDFDGDGTYDWQSESTGSTTYVYGNVGNYTARLRVTDEEGYKDVDTMDVFILEHHQTHSRIKILKDSDFKKQNSGVVGGSGTKDDPYIIEGWHITVKNNNIPINIPAGEGILIFNTDSHVIIRHVTIEWEEGGLGDISHCGIRLINATNVVIENCYFLDTGYGIIVGERSSCTIRNNLFIGLQPRVDPDHIYFDSIIGILIHTYFLQYYSEAIIENNRIVGYYQGVWVEALARALIQNNIIEPHGHGIVTNGDKNRNPDVIITHNKIDGKHVKFLSSIMPTFVFTGIKLRNSYLNVDVEYNIIKSFGRGIDSPGGSNCHIHYNNIIYNSRASLFYTFWETGLKNWGSTTVDATYNWWGSPDGPGHDGLGPRNTVSGNVDYEPYLTAAVPNAGPTTNPPPNKPTIDGPTSGKPGVEYTYTAMSTDPEGEALYYLFFWGDGTTSGWIGPYGSGETASVTHTWETKGVYQVKAVAKDISGCVSEWSDSLIATMPVNQQYSKSNILITNGLQSNPFLLNSQTQGQISSQGSNFLQFQSSQLLQMVKTTKTTNR